MTPTEQTIYDPQQVLEISRRPGALYRTLKSGDRIRARADLRCDVSELLREHAVSYYLTRSGANTGELVFEITEPDPREYRSTLRANAY